MKRSIQPFLFALLGALVGAATVKSLDRPASAAAGNDVDADDVDAKTIRAGTIFARRIWVIGEEKTFPNIEMTPGQIAIQGSDELGEARLTQQSLKLQNIKAKRTLRLDAERASGNVEISTDKGDGLHAVFEVVR